MVRRHDTLDGWVITDAPTALEVLPRPGAVELGPLRRAAPRRVRAVGAGAGGDRGRRARAAGGDAAGAGRPRPAAAHAHAGGAAALVRARARSKRCGRSWPRRCRRRSARSSPARRSTSSPAFTRPVPFRVVARLLGLPRADWAELEALAHAASTDDTATEDFAALRARILAERDVMRFFVAHLDGPERGAPAAPARRGRGRRRSRPREAAGLCREVLVAGSDSVGHLLAGALRRSRRRPAGRPAPRSSSNGWRSTRRSRPSGDARRGNRARRRRDPRRRPRPAPLRAAQRGRRTPPELRARHPLLPRRRAGAAGGRGRAARGAGRDERDRPSPGRPSASPHPPSAATGGSCCASAGRVGRAPAWLPASTRTETRRARRMPRPSRVSRSLATEAVPGAICRRVCGASDDRAVPGLDGQARRARIGARTGDDEAHAAAAGPHVSAHRDHALRSRIRSTVRGRGRREQSVEHVAALAARGAR